MKTTESSTLVGAVVAALLATTGAVRAQTDFPFGAAHVYIADGINIDQFKACGFNSIGVTLNDSVPSKNLDTLAAESLEVVAGLPSNDWVLDCAAYAEMIHWQAEDEVSISLVHNVGVEPTITRVEHLKGGPDGNAWRVDTPESAGVAWQLVDHMQLKQKTYTALFYLEVDSIPEGDIAQLRVFDLDSPSVSFTRTITGSDFADTASFQACSLSYAYPTLASGIWRSSVTVEWYGTCKLSMDSLVLFNTEAREYIRDT